MTSAAVVIEFRPEWVPAPAVRAIERARAPVLVFLGRGPRSTALMAPVPVVPPASDPAAALAPTAVVPTPAASPPATAPASVRSGSSEPPVFSVSSLPVAKDDTASPSRTAAHLAPPPRTPVSVPVRAAPQPPPRARAVSVAQAAAPPPARGLTPASGDAPAAQKPAPAKPAPAAPAPAPGSLDDLIRKAVEADAKKK